MKSLIILFICASFGLRAQNEYPAELTLSVGFEHSNSQTMGWQFMMTGGRPLGSHPKWSLGLNVCYGTTEFNRDSDAIDTPPNEVSGSTGNEVVLLERPFYSRFERVRFGLEGRYQLSNREKGNIFIGISVSGELLTRWKEFGENAYYGYDTTGMFTEVYVVPYEFDLKTDKIENPFALYFQPYLDYRYHINEQVALMLRGTATARLFPNDYPTVGRQINLGVSFKL